MWKSPSVTQTFIDIYIPCVLITSITCEPLNVRYRNVGFIYRNNDHLDIKQSPQYTQIRNKCISIYTKISIYRLLFYHMSKIYTIDMSTQTPQCLCRISSVFLSFIDAVHSYVFRYQQSAFSYRIALRLNVCKCKLIVDHLLGDIFVLLFLLFICFPGSLSYNYLNRLRLWIISESFEKYKFNKNSQIITSHLKWEFSSNSYLFCWYLQISHFSFLYNSNKHNYWAWELSSATVSYYFNDIAPNS